MPRGDCGAILAVSRAGAGAVAVVMGSGAGTECCSGCNWEEYNLVSVAFHNSERAIDIFRAHGVLPASVTCPSCGLKCTYYEDRRLWRCTGHSRVGKKKRRRSCTFSVSDNNGTFLERTRLEPWQVLLFINLFITKRWSHGAAVRNIGISLATSVDWRSFCAEVCEQWVGEEGAIGGEGVVVEIDETHFVKRKFNRGRVLSSVWLLGGIERETDKKFIVPLSEPLSEECRRRDADTLIPIIQKHVLPGTIINTDCWAAYGRLKDRGYSHVTVNHKQNFVDPSDAEVRTQKIERLWRDVKEWCARPGNRPKYVHQYLGRYVFLKEVSPGQRLHQFLEAAKTLYPHRTHQEAKND